MVLLRLLLCLLLLSHPVLSGVPSPCAAGGAVGAVGAVGGLVGGREVDGLLADSPGDHAGQDADADAVAAAGDGDVAVFCPVLFSLTFSI